MVSRSQTSSNLHSPAGPPSDAKPRFYTRCTFGLVHGQWPAQRIFPSKEGRAPHYCSIPSRTTTLPYIQNLDIHFSLARSSKCHYPYISTLKPLFATSFAFGDSNVPRKLCWVTLDVPFTPYPAWSITEYSAHTMALTVIKTLTGFEKLGIVVKGRLGSWYDLSRIDKSYAILEAILEPTLGPCILSGERGDRIMVERKWLAEPRWLADGRVLEFFPLVYQESKDRAEFLNLHVLDWDLWRYNVGWFKRDFEFDESYIGE